MGNDLEIFVITSGRETFDYVMKSIHDQSVSRKVTVIKDMLWVDALNECTKRSRSKFYLRVDDDMALHCHAVAYYISKIPLCIKKKYGIYVCKLWEDWSNKPAGGLRMYRTDVAQRVGFRPNKLGKVDKVFRKDMKKIGFTENKDPSLIGLHLLNSEKTQIRMREIWKKQAKSEDIFVKSFDNIIHPCTDSLDKQYKVLSQLKRKNKNINSSYYNFFSSASTL